jgi:large subunit ribosomal protein L4
MNLDVYNLDNAKVGEVAVSEEVFGAEVKPHLHYEVVKWQLARRRAGTHKAKTRSEVSATGAKMYRQKGTGNARHGSKRVPTFVGGGVAHGPSPRNYEYKLPKKVKRGALRSALSQKFAEGRIKVIDAFDLNEPKTTVAQLHLSKLEASNALIVDIDNHSLKLSVRNIPEAKFLASVAVNVRDIIHYDNLVITRSAIEAIDGALKS